MKPEIYVGADPGDCTGLSILMGEDYFTYELLWKDALAKLEEHCTPGLYTTEPGKVVIFCEGYKIKDVNNTHYDAIYFIGGLTYLCLKNDWELHIQHESQRRSITPSMMEKLGWWMPSKDGHRNDAGRHLLLGMMRKGYIDKRRLL